jgi:hypothetical protein
MEPMVLTLVFVAETIALEGWNLCWFGMILNDDSPSGAIQKNFMQKNTVSQDSVIIFSQQTPALITLHFMPIRIHFIRWSNPCL